MGADLSLPEGSIQIYNPISENVSRCISHDSKPNEINSECLKTTSNKRVLNSPKPSSRPSKLRF